MMPFPAELTSIASWVALEFRILVGEEKSDGRRRERRFSSAAAASLRVVGADAPRCACGSAVVRGGRVGGHSRNPMGGGVATNIDGRAIAVRRPFPHPPFVCRITQTERVANGVELAEHRRGGKRFDLFALATLAERHGVVSGGVVVPASSKPGSDPAYRHGCLLGRDLPAEARRGDERRRRGGRTRENYALSVRARDVTFKPMRRRAPAVGRVVVVLTASASSGRGRIGIGSQTRSRPACQTKPCL